MAISEKIPIVVGVTGHRNIVKEDKPAIKKLVREGLEKILSLRDEAKKKGGEDTPVVMLNAFAQGADMLCAEVAFEMGIPVYAVLPCPAEEYIASFDDETDKQKLLPYLEKVQRQLVAPDIEQNKDWMKIDDDSYRYRQLGIYIAEHSHVLIALWDGKPPKSKYGCGTVEVINFALEQTFLDKDHLFKPSTVNDCAVYWVKSRRQGDGSEADVQCKWLASELMERGEKGEQYSKPDFPYKATGAPPEFLRDIIKKTVKYNAESFTLPDTSVRLWKETDELDDYRKGLRYHYAKADELSYTRNQVPYNKFLLAIAVIATLVALTFMIYDDASLPFMIFPCTLLLGGVIAICLYGRKKDYHKNYIEYRVFAETLRTQFYTSMCMTRESEILLNVCDLASWTQKVDAVWMDKGLRALAVIHSCRRLDIEQDRIIDTWIGRNAKPTGQLKYHADRTKRNHKKAEFYDKLSGAFQVIAIVVYVLLFSVELAACILKALGIDWFWEGNAFLHVSCRNLGAILMGLFAAGSLLLSSYWGKLSYDRKADNNKKMIHFYATALERWSEVKGHPAEVEKFVKEIAREEIVENGIWCSYVSENRLDINV